MAKVQIEKPDRATLEAMGVFDWPIWEKEPSTFDWYYDTTEQCYILDGEVIVHTDEGDYHIKAGDFVTFEKGLSCRWEILKTIRKHYNFV